MESSRAADGALDGLAQLQEMLKGARSATPEQRAAGPPPAMMEMMRMMAAQRQETQGSSSRVAAPSAAATPPVVAPAPPSADGVAIAPAAAPLSRDEPAVPSLTAAPPVDAVDAVPADPPRWRAQTTWVMSSVDGSGLRLVICEDDATEESEVAAARLEGQTVSQLTTLSPSSDSDLAGPSAAAPPCDLLLQAGAGAAIVRATAIRYSKWSRTNSHLSRTVSSGTP